MLTPYQILAPAVSVFVVAYAWNLVYHQKKTLWEAVLWTVFWGAIAVIALFPQSIEYLQSVTGIKEGENAVLVTFLGVLFFMMFYLIVRLESLEQKYARMVRKIALEGLEEEKGK